MKRALLAFAAATVVLCAVHHMVVQAQTQAPVPRAFYSHRLEPQSTVLAGAGQSDPESFAAVTSAIDTKPPMLSMSYIDLRDDVPAYFARLRDQLAKYPTLIVPQIGLSLNSGDAKKHYEADVAAGKDDARLHQLCDGLKSLDRPVFLRVGYEFNGPWNGYDPASYVSAFRHIAETVRGCDLQNVAMVWDWAPEARGKWAAYYPGDAWVDWWALNLFEAKDIDAAWTRDFLAEAEAHKFPVMIGEATPRGHSVGEGQRAVDAWYAPFFALIERSRGIKAFCYIDWDWSKYPQWKDWGDGRIERNAIVLSAYRSEMAKSLYAGARDRKATRALLRSR